MYFGVNSNYPSNAKLTNGYDLYHWVMRMSSPPAFWGRNIVGDQKLTKEEADFLHEKHCAVALIYNGFSESDMSKINGVEDGIKAANAARELAVPVNQNIAIFADINDAWSVNHNWMIGFSSSVLREGYIPGYIANTDSSMNFNFGRQCSHYVQYMGDVGRESTVYWATEPKLEEEPLAWSPYAPSELEPNDMHIWRVGKTITYKNNIEVMRNYIQEDAYSHFLWTADKG